MSVSYIHDRIKASREAQNLTAEDIARHLGIGLLDYQKFESEDCIDVPLNSLCQLSELFSVSIDVLANGTASHSKEFAVSRENQREYLNDNGCFYSVLNGSSSKSMGILVKQTSKSIFEFNPANYNSVNLVVLEGEICLCDNCKLEAKDTVKFHGK